MGRNTDVPEGGDILIELPEHVSAEDAYQCAQVRTCQRRWVISFVPGGDVSAVRELSSAPCDRGKEKAKMENDQVIRLLAMDENIYLATMAGTTSSDSNVVSAS